MQSKGETFFRVLIKHHMGTEQMGWARYKAGCGAATGAATCVKNVGWVEDDSEEKAPGAWEKVAFVAPSAEQTLRHHLHLSAELSFLFSSLKPGQETKARC
jgi:hypothetical protein